MPFTEIITPSMVQSNEAREAFFNIILPTIKSIVTPAPGSILSTSGHILTKSNLDVPKSSFFPVLGLEWEDSKYFYEVLQSKEFPAFVEATKPYITAPPSPGLYETDASPKDVFASPITDVFRISIGDDPTKEARAKTAWSKLVKELGDTKVLSGISVNLPDKLFLGMIGWSGVEQRVKILKKISDLKVALEKLEDAESFVAQFSTPI